MKTSVNPFRAAVSRAVCLSVCSLVSTVALAADRYGVIGVTNNTEGTENFSVKVGSDGKWEAKTIAPGGKEVVLAWV